MDLKSQRAQYTISVVLFPNLQEKDIINMDINIFSLK